LLRVFPGEAEKKSGMLVAAVLASAVPEDALAVERH
jgi:hypothetical protein